MQETHKILLEQLAHTLFDVPTDTVVDDAVIREAIHQSVITLLPIPEHKLYLQMLGNNMRVSWEHQQVHEMMHSHNIPYVVMKGVVSASFYPDPLRRPLGDVDFLVREEDLLNARKVLEENGFTSPHDIEEVDYHAAYHAGKTTLELHRKSHIAPNENAIHRYLADIIDKAEFRDGCMCASTFHHGLVLLTHSSKHLLNTGIGLRHLCDWAVFYASFTDEAFCSLFESTLKEVGLWKYAQILSQTCIKYLGAPQRSWIGEGDDALLEAIIMDVFDGGNFGFKDQERVNHVKFMTDREQHNITSKGPIYNFVRALANKARKDWPLCNKFCLLLPFCMLFSGIKYVILISQGKRPAFHLKDAFTGAQKRKALYQQFELYKTE